jgi:hypothetical protein
MCFGREGEGGASVLNFNVQILLLRLRWPFPVPPRASR